MRATLALAGVLVGGACTGARTAGPNAAIDRVAYPNGKARFEFELHDGLPNGRGRAWHPNGKLASDGTYRDGARHGRFWFYDTDGKFVAQALFLDNAEVWRATSETEAPPEQLAQGLAFTPRPATADAIVVDTAPETAWEASRTAPRPYFSLLDRTTAPARAGAQVGVSDARGAYFGAATRIDVFGHYRLGHYGVFAQVSESLLGVDRGMTLAGRYEAFLAGTYHRELGPATLSASAGFISPFANTDAPGFVASYAGAEQRPTDVAAALPAPFTLRSSASMTASRGSLLVEVDTGIDWLLGSDEHAFGALARANVGLGFGTRATMLTAELANVIPLTGAEARLHALSLGGTITYSALWFSAALAFSSADTISVLGSVGHDL